MATFTGSSIEVMTEDCEEGQLTNRQYVQLGRAIASPDMESIALGYLNIDKARIKSLKTEHRENTEAFNRDIIELWANKNPDSNGVKVGFYFLFVVMRKHNEDSSLS